MFFWTIRITEFTDTRYSTRYLISTACLLLPRCARSKSRAFNTDPRKKKTLEDCPARKLREGKLDIWIAVRVSAIGLQSTNWIIYI